MAPPGRFDLIGTMFALGGSRGLEKAPAPGEWCGKARGPLQCSKVRSVHIDG
jgi:hypothetical protein